MADLSSLALLRNDPDAALKLIKQAELMDVDAQYATGLIYAEGRGVEQSDLMAYFWLSLAVDQGDEDAKLLRMVVASTISQEDFDAAVALLERYRSGQYQLTTDSGYQ